MWLREKRLHPHFGGCQHNFRWGQGTAVGQKMLGYRNAHDQFDAKFPGFLEACEPLIGFVVALSKMPGEKTTHLSAIANQCGVAWDVYAATVSPVREGFPVPAMVLCRNLFEITIGALYLTGHPELLNDFLEAGQLLPLELIVNVGHPSASEQTKYTQLNSRFRDGWHRLKISQLAERVGFESLYGSFYKEACSIAHAHSFVSLIPRSGVGTPFAEGLEGRDYATMALHSATLMVYILFDTANRILDLGHDQELGKAQKNMQAYGFLD